MADSATEIDLDSVIDRLLEGKILFFSHLGPRRGLSKRFWETGDAGSMFLSD
ncbi:hypothetical protein L218DRAFT_960502 [Marasmius fiardii PR-910]|nr:hypothetical protein L218DRAFT_960502 [Marasmius fiardii PR-910]